MIEVCVRALVAIGILLIGGCGNCGENGGSGAPNVQRGAVDPPGDLVWEIDVAGGRRVLGAIRERLRAGVVRVAVPGTPAGLVEGMAPTLAEVADRVPEDAPVVIVRVGTGDSAATAGAARVRLEQGEGAEEHPLGPGVTLVPGGPMGSRFIGARQAPGTPTAVLLDDAIVFADHEDALGVAIQYLVDTRLPRVARTDGVTVRLPAGASAQLRLVADGALASAAQSLREAARLERARHTEAPALGEPEALLDVVRETLAGWIALLPDLGEVRATIAPAGDVLEIAVEADVAPGSALARRLRGRGVAGLPETALGLPRDTALAVAWDLGQIAEPAEGDAMVPALMRIAGDRLSEEDRAALVALETQLDRARGRTRVLAIGGDAGRAWAWRWEQAPEDAQVPVMETTGARPADVAAELRARLGAVVETRWVGVAGGTLLGCPDGIDAGSWRTGSATESRLRLCAVEGVSRDLVVSTPELVDTWIAVERMPEGVVGARPGAAGGTLADEADVARQLRGLRDAQLGVVVLAPERLPAALSLVMPSLGARGAASPAAGAAAVVIALGRSDSGVRMRVRAGARGIQALLGLAQPLLEDQDPAP